MVAPTPSKGHSAQVQLELRIGEARFPLAQIGGGELVFEQSVSLPGESGEVRAQIDDQEQRWIATWEPSKESRKIVPAVLLPLN